MLSRLGRRKFVSVAGLADVLQDIKEHGMPDATSRSSIKRARDKAWDADVTSRYGTIVRSIECGVDEEGQPCVFWVADSRACLYYMISECGKLEAFIRQILVKNPCSPDNPWGIIVYNDEIAPGNQLLHHNSRKTQAFYYSFIEFGAEALYSELLWFTLTVARSDEVSEIGGWSFGTFATSVMLSFDVWGTEGFICGTIIIWARIKLIVCDEAALKATLDVKGAGGNLPCFKCANILSRKAFAKSDKRSMYSITEMDPRNFDLHDNESIRANAEHLRDVAPPVSKVGKFKELQVSLGLNYNPHGLILRLTHFDIIKGACYDPQHVYLVNGIWNSEVGQLLRLLHKTLGIRLTDIASFFHSFNWPKESNTGKKIFDDRSQSSVTEKTEKKHPSFSCSASDALGSFAVIQEFLSLQVSGEARRRGDNKLLAACASFFALSSVIVLATMIPRGGVTSEKLMAAITRHMTLHKAAYGDEHWVPKFHYAFHLPGQLAIWGILIFCFTHERKHKEVKRYINGRQNTSATFEKNILQDVLHMQKLALQEEHPYPRGTQLLNPRPGTPPIVKLIRSNFPGCTEIRRSVDAKANNFVTCHVGDVVFFKWGDGMAVGKITLLCSVDNECMAFLQVWTRLPQLNMFNTNGDNYFVLLTDIVDCCVYRMQRDVAYVVPPRGAVVSELLKK